MGSGGTTAWEPRSGGLKDRTAKDTFKKKKARLCLVAYSFTVEGKNRACGAYRKL